MQFQQKQRQLATSVADSYSMRIRTSLLVIIIAVLIPTIIGAGLVVRYVYHEQQDAYRESIQERSSAMALVIDQEFSKRAAILEILAEAPMLETRDFEGFYRYARRFDQSGRTGIQLQDAAGNTLINTRLPFDNAAGTPLAFLTQLRRSSAPDATIVTNVFRSPVTGIYTFAIQVPVKQAGQIPFYLSMASFTSELQALFGEQKLKEGWIGTIFDRNGVIAARTIDSGKYVGQTPYEDVRKNLVEKGEGFYDGTTLDGLSVTYFISRAPKSGWVFMTLVPRAQLHATAFRAAIILTGIAALMIGVGLALAFLAARRIAQPMETLRKATDRLGEGAPVSVQHSGIVEIDAVNTGLAQASHDIQDARTDLEKRIAEAVATAERSQQALLQAQKLEALGRLTGGIAHDFNNVLQTLTTGLQLSYLTCADLRVRSTLATCEQAVERAAALVSQLMSFARVQDSRLTTVHLPQKIEEITPMLKGALRADIELKVDAGENIWSVTVDALQLELALLNLAINARDAMPDGGTFEIRMRNQSFVDAMGELPGGDYVHVAVIDSGSGMTPEVMAKAIDPFFTTKGVGKGTGLGLAQIYGFVKQVNGALTIESTVGEGTTINLYLSRSGVATASEQRVDDRKTVSLKGRVLLVDDDRLVLDVVKPALEMAGLEVSAAQSGDEALAILERGETFDAVFSDIVMPGRISGIELAKIVAERYPKTRLILATGYTEQRVSTPGVRVLAKPYSNREAIEALREELATGRARISV